MPENKDNKREYIKFDFKDKLGLLVNVASNCPNYTEGNYDVWNKRVQEIVDVLTFEWEELKSKSIPMDKVKGVINRISDRLKIEEEECRTKLEIELEMAKDCQKELQSELDKYRWIPVSERLPEDSVKVLVISLEDSNDPICFGFCDIGEEEWDDGYSDKAPVTHWMPLPDPPQDKD